MTEEFTFLRRLAERCPPLPAGQVGIGDDAAVLPGGLLAAVDTLVADRHFRLEWTTPADVGRKAMAVNLSDLAAMGGEPTAALAAVTLPTGPPGLADALAEGLLDAAAAYGCPLVGGDTTSGPVLVVTVAVLGTVPEDRGPVLRRGARPGDGVWVTGPLGAAATALDALRAGRRPPPEEADRLHRPRPRLAEGQAAARAGASAMIDVSDGLAADLGHVLDASGAGVRLDADALPRDPGTTLGAVLGGGDDYELCFTAADVERVTASFADAGLDPPARIGTVTDGDRVLVRGGAAEPLEPIGWAHEVP